MIKECHRCIHYEKDVSEDPCFQCLGTPFKRFFDPMGISNDEKYKELKNLFSTYKFQKANLQILLESDPTNSHKTVSNFIHTKEKIMKLLESMIENITDISIIERRKDAKPRIII